MSIRIVSRKYRHWKPEFEFLSYRQLPRDQLTEKRPIVTNNRLHPSWNGAACPRFPVVGVQLGPKSFRFRCGPAAFRINRYGDQISQRQSSWRVGFMNTGRLQNHPRVSFRYLTLNYSPPNCRSAPSTKLNSGLAFCHERATVWVCKNRG